MGLREIEQGDGGAGDVGILLVEDSDLDDELIRARLRADGLGGARITRVQTREEFLAAFAAASLTMNSTSGAASVLGSNVLLRIDDLELKGFAGARSVYALVPRDDPGLAAFEAGRKALDRHMVGEGLAHLAAVERGMLRQAAKVVSARHQPPA